MSDDNARPDDPARVAEALARLRAGVLQRRAELATLSEELRRLPPALARAHELQYVEEPESTSHRPVIGRFIVLAKKVVHQAFMKWYLESLTRQQNAFNRAATEALRELFERQGRLADELDELVDSVERSGE